MIKKLILIAACISAAVFMTGCWSSREPKELAIVDSSLYDKLPDGSYKVTAEIMNPAGIGGAGMLGSGSGNKSPFVTFSGTGPSIREAIKCISLSREMKDFGQHNKARFLSERFARDGIAPFLDLIARERFTDEKPHLIVVRSENPEKIYDCMLGISSMPGDYIENLYKHQPADSAHGVFVTTLEFMKAYLTEGREPVAGLATIVESADRPSGNVGLTTGSGAGRSPVNYRIRYEGLAAFKDGRLVGFLDCEGAEAYNIIMGKAKAAFFTVPVGDGRSTVIDITESRCEIKSDIAGGKAVVKINVKASGNVSEEGSGIDITTSEGLKSIRRALEKQIEEQLSKTVNKVQNELASDIFGFGEFLHIQHPDKWRGIKDRWNDDYFPFAEVSVSVKTNIMTTGKIDKPISLPGEHK